MISRKSMRPVTNIENNVMNIINRILPSNGNRNSPTWTVPDEHNVTRQDKEVICLIKIKFINNI